MKWYNSLVTKITLIFTLAFIGVLAVLYIIHTQIKKTEIVNLHRFTKVLLQNMDNKDKFDFTELQKAGFTLVTNEHIKELVLKKRRFFKSSRGTKRHHHNRKIKFKIIEYNRKFFLVIGRELVFKVPHEKDAFSLIIFPISALLFIIFLYIATIRSILPLYSLRQKVKEFANGNYDVDCSSQKKDEIAILSN